MTNFGTDLKDSEVLIKLLSQLDERCDCNGLDETDVQKRAEMVRILFSISMKIASSQKYSWLGI